MSEVTDLLKEIKALLQRLEHDRKKPERQGWKPTEVADAIGISKDAVYDLIHAGQLGAVRAGDRYVVPDVELRAYLDCNRAT